jgi:signal transduction histidine kinase/CheY-like chemotaxis protein
VDVVGDMSTNSNDGDCTLLENLSVTKIFKDVFVVHVSNDSASQLECIKSILEEFGKLLAFLYIPNLSRKATFDDIEVVYVNKNFNVCDALLNVDLKKSTKISSFKKSILYSTEFRECISAFLTPDPKIKVRSTDKIETPIHRPQSIQQMMSPSLKARGLGTKTYYQYYFNRTKNYIGIFGKDVTSEVNERMLFEKILDTRNEFMGHVSHEIRTPLNGIVSTIDLIENTSRVPQSLKTHIETLNQCSLSLLTIINDLMDLSRMEAKKLELVYKPFSLKSMILSAISLVDGMMTGKELTITHFIDPKISDGLIGDSDRIRQILTNLIGNAIKFTQRGSITVRAVHVENVDVSNDTFKTIIGGDPKKSIPTIIDEIPTTLETIRFEVIDTGIGIPPERQLSVFQPFTQMDSSLRKKHSGVGLGLSICKNLVELMNGSIGVNSTEGRGSTFYFTLRLPTHISSSRNSEEMIKILRGKRVLIVDDNPTNLKYVVTTLSKWKMACTFFTSSREAIEMCLEHGVDLDAIVTDICLPIIDGVQLASMIRSYGYTCPIIGVSSINIEHVQSDNFDIVLQKPINSFDLVDIVAKLLTNTPPIRKSSSCGNVNAFSGIDFPITPREDLILKHDVRDIEDISILLVEDNPTNVKVTIEQLQSFGVKNIDTSNDGVSGFMKICQGDYHIVLMDICLPGEMDGIECTEKSIEYFIEHRSNEVQPYFIALTANTMTETIQAALKAGMAKILTKPIRLGELKSIVNLVYNTLLRKGTGK